MLEKSAFGKTFTISARGKTRAKRQREHATGTPWDDEGEQAARWGACTAQQQRHHTPRTAPHRPYHVGQANKLAQTESLKNDKQHPLPLSRERERERQRARGVQRERQKHSGMAKRECLLYPVRAIKGIKSCQDIEFQEVFKETENIPKQ